MPNEETTKLSFYFVQMCIEGGRSEAWKLLAIKYQKWMLYFSSFLIASILLPGFTYFVRWSRIKETPTHLHYWLKKKLEELERKRREDVYWSFNFFLDIICAKYFTFKHNPKGMSVSGFPIVTQLSKSRNGLDRLGACV